MEKEEKLEWIYKGANSLVDREEYLLGRKVDKTLEQLNEEEKEKKFTLPTPKNHVEHECIPPSIRDFNKIVQAEQVDMSAKLQEDPLIAIKKREEEARRQFLQNPVQLKKLQEALKAQEMKKKKKKSSKLDKKIAEKLKLLKSGDSFSGKYKKDQKKQKEQALNTILMHKFNALKDKLTENDLDDIMNGKIDSDDSSSEEEKNNRKQKNLSDSGSSSSEKDYKRKPLKKRERKKAESSDEDKRKSSDREKRRRSRSKEDCRRKERSVERETDSSRSRAKNKESSRKHKERSNSRENRIVKKIKIQEHRKSRSSESKHQNINKNKRGTESEDLGNSDQDLDQMILKKLRSLRDKEEHTQTKKILPEKPPHLKERSLSPSNNEDCSDSDLQTQEKTKSFGLVSAEGKKIALKHEISKDNKKPKVNSKNQSPIKPEKHVKVAKKLSEKEKEKLRQEMMMNATARDKERELNVKKYRELDKKEEESTKKKYNKELVHNELVKSTRVSTVEERIKSNVNNIQRSSRHMDSHFSRR